MKYFSMFSGIGGFELGIQRACGLQPEATQLQVDNDSASNNGDSLQGATSCVGYSEIDKYADATYQQHFGGHRNYGDATKINPRELPDFDLLVGGFPCQAFSVAGKRLGFDDTRGTLFFDIARILSEKRPRHLVLENVKGLLSHDSGKTFQTIIGVLTDLGYFVEWQVLNSKDFGVPQNRERVFIVGHLGGEPRRKVFPIFGENPANISEDVTLIEDSARHTPREYAGVAPTVQSSYGMGGGHVPLVRQLTETRTDEAKAIRREQQKLGRDWSPRRGKVLKPRQDEVANTVTTGESKEKYLLDTTRIRRLTPLECERLQGFPDNWTVGSDTQRYKQCGNAVTVNVVEAVMRGLYQ